MRENIETVTDRLLNTIRNKYFGKYRGEVTDNVDPANRGRVEVKVPCLLRKETMWAMPCLPFGGKDMGLFMIPEQGTSVWVEFEGGDISHPIWSGCYWGDDESPKNNNNAAPKERLIRSQTGLTISLDDKEETVTIRDKDDSNTITIDVKNGTVKVKGKHTVIVEAQNVQLGGEFGLEPVVKGNQLMAYLNAVALAAYPKVPAVPVPPPPPSLLSTVVKTV
jgi:uncharacterized protein involved in type VI secretion and phage assembly